ncbi:MAG: response regulator [Anaerolineales bacterium]|nr:response regulator [Anaerolineales bacterium]
MPTTAAVNPNPALVRRPKTVRTTPRVATSAATSAPARAVAVAMADGAERDILVERLRGLGWTVWVATDGPGALHLLETRQPALILLDLWLPQINGLDVLRQAGRYVPAVLISDFASPEVRIGAAAVGALGFLLQPVDVDALIAQAQHILTLPLAGQRVAEERYDGSSDGNEVEHDPGHARVGWADRAGELRGPARLGAHA